MFKTACSCQQQGRTWGVPRPLFTVSEVLSGQRCAANPELDAKRIPRVGYGFLVVPAKQKPGCWARGAPAQLYELGGVQPPGPLSFVHILEFLAQKDWSYLWEHLWLPQQRAANSRLYTQSFQRGNMTSVTRARSDDSQQHHCAPETQVRLGIRDPLHPDLHSVWMTSELLQQGSDPSFWS